jgi:hypothetical protein
MLGHPHLQKIGVFDFELRIIIGIARTPVGLSAIPKKLETLYRQHFE